MSEPTYIQADLSFKRELSRLSGSLLNQCMQCGTCSAVCSLAPAERPLPAEGNDLGGLGLEGEADRKRGYLAVPPVRRLQHVLSPGM